MQSDRCNRFLTKAITATGRATAETSTRLRAARIYKDGQIFDELTPADFINEEGAIIS
jgi:hypothetical protein